MPTVTTYYQNQERPTWSDTWTEHGARLDLSDETFTARLVNHSTDEVGLVKTSGVFGYDSASVRNIEIVWAAGDLNIAPAMYKLLITGTSGGGELAFRAGNEPRIQILAAIVGEAVIDILDGGGPSATYGGTPADGGTP